MTQQKRHAFTLIELLTVVAIITLLISILVPAVNAARKQAARAAARAQISGLSQGIEMFRTDFGYYPSSVPQDADGVNADSTRINAGSSHVVQGAHRLAMAMVGLDQLGCPVKTGPRSFNNESAAPDSIKGWYYTIDGSFTASTVDAASKVYYPGDANWGDPDKKTTRRSPYIDPKGFNIVKDNSINNGGSGAIVLTDRYDKKADQAISTSSPYEQHSIILYYAANDRGKYLWRATGDPANNDDVDPKNIYYHQDNKNILSSSATQFKNDYTLTNFYKFIEDPNAQIGTSTITHMPKNPDSFLLISRGWDGVYGTDDDVTNWKE
jgi:prepilin-type N-terminal cleavage/methylation domain-containing protein